jgi:hypothetical protein
MSDFDVQTELYCLHVEYGDSMESRLVLCGCTCVSPKLVEKFVLRLE